MFKVAIIGGKETDNYTAFKEKCVNLLRNKPKNEVYVLSTGDDFTVKFAEEYRLTIEIFVPDFKKHKKEALKFRNEKMLNGCNAAIVFKTNIKENKILATMCKDRNIPLREIMSI